jgi:NitT/TauT family transport system permease protein/taurine transport system permease protein
MAIAFNAVLRWIENKAAIWRTGTRGSQRTIGGIASDALQPAA